MDIGTLAPWLAAIEITLAIVITVLVIIQSRGGDLGSIMGGDSSSNFRTRRGMEVVMHRWTIYFSIIFFIVTFFAFIAMGQAG